MARWGIEVPSADDEEEERTQAALAFDDAEFQLDPEVESDGGDGGADAKSEQGADAKSEQGANAKSENGADPTAGLRLEA